MPPSFAVSAATLIERADVGYAAGTVRFDEAYAQPRYPLVSLGDITTAIQYGSSARADATSDDGIPMLRMVNISNDQVDTGSLKYVQLPANDVTRFRLAKGDLLFNRTNSKELVGKCAVFDEDGEYVFASYLIRVRVDSKLVRPDFIAAFLATSAGRIQLRDPAKSLMRSEAAVASAVGRARGGGWRRRCWSGRPGAAS